ncbi:hypothetical protein BCEN4_590032 [Burkholderia cenocepacia]|nr:hypothetical protein BCEN4_590032 [Burkholderia cenocepacia]
MGTSYKICHQAGVGQMSKARIAGLEGQTKSKSRTSIGSAQ